MDPKLESGKGVNWNDPRKSPCSSNPVMDDTFAPMEVRVAVVVKAKSSQKTTKRKTDKEWQ